MMTSLRVLAGIVIAVGLAEMALTGIAALSGMSAWTERFIDMTRIDPPSALRLAVGVLGAVSAATLLVGYWRPGWSIVGGALLTLYAGAVLIRRLSIDAAPSPMPYVLFTACGIVAVVVGTTASP